MVNLLNTVGLTHLHHLRTHFIRISYSGHLFEAHYFVTYGLTPNELYEVSAAKYPQIMDALELFRQGPVIELCSF